MAHSAVCRSLVVALVLGAAGGLAAQQSTTAEPSGSVAGTVFSEDSQRPVRFAQIVLQRVADVLSNGSAGFEERRRGLGGNLSARSGPDGTFFAGGIAPGDYYIFAGAPGYLTERALLQQAIAGGADPNLLLQQLPVVHVAAESTASATLQLVRGAAISGRLQWDDGAPGAGIAVSVQSTAPDIRLPETLQRIESPGGNNFNNTDDRGVFRLAGLAPGTYYVQAILQPPPTAGPLASNFVRQQFTSPIRVFAPSAYRKADAAPITVKAGEEHGDLQINLDLRGLHTVSGTVTSANPSAPVAYGRVQLTDTTDNTLIVTGGILPNGDFAVHFVPPGSYTLQISNASTQAPSYQRGPNGGPNGQSGGVRFAPFSESITVPSTDLSGVNASLNPQ